MPNVQAGCAAIRPIRLDIHRTAIPMRSFQHAAASRSVAEAVLLRCTFDDGQVGWGETLPREYVTGETIDSVIAALAETLWPACAARSDIRQTLRDLTPPQPGQASRNAAICAMDLATLPLIYDAKGHVDGTLLPGAASRPARRIGPRVSGVLGSPDPAKTLKKLRLMRWIGLRDFKLKLGFGDDADLALLQAVHGRIGRAVAAGKCTLRVDVNGGWDRETTPERVAELEPYGVCAVEQPVFAPAEDLLMLAERCSLPLMADEALLGAPDADVLLRSPGRVWWNVRISKNAGLQGAMALARRAAEGGVTWSLGCMVGETGLLSAAQRKLLEWAPAPGPRFVEGNYGRFLLRADLTRPSLRFGYGGRLRVRRGAGLGVSVDESALARYAEHVCSLPC